LTGTVEELGDCSCNGELVFVPGEEEDTLYGLGVVAFTAANGDLLVGTIAMEVDTTESSFYFTVHWGDAVTFSDGTITASTGRFVEHRPQGIRRQGEPLGIIIL
jgi:hypothetical protein